MADQTLETAWLAIFWAFCFIKNIGKTRLHMLNVSMFLIKKKMKIEKDIKHGVVS